MSKKSPASKDKQKGEKDMNAKEEQMLLYQVLEEHIDSEKGKEYQPCQTCIRVALNKGYRLGKEEAREEKSDEEIFEETKQNIEILKKVKLGAYITKLFPSIQRFIQDQKSSDFEKVKELIESKKLLESLSDLEHQQWAEWADYFLSVKITQDMINRWERQINSPYWKLSEKEKDSDRKFAKLVLKEVLQKLNDVFGEKE